MLRRNITTKVEFALDVRNYCFVENIWQADLFGQDTEMEESGLGSFITALVVVVARFGLGNL